MHSFNSSNSSQQTGSSDNNPQQTASVIGETTIVASQRASVAFQSLLKTTTPALELNQVQAWWCFAKQADCPKVLLDVLHTYYQEILLSHPKNPEALVRGAWCQWRLGTLLAIEGVTRCQQAVNFNPTSGESWVYLAQFQRHCGLIEKSVSSLQKAMQYLPSVEKIEARTLLIQWQTVAFQQHLLTINQWIGLQLENRFYQWVDCGLLLIKGQFGQLHKKHLDATTLTLLSKMVLPNTPPPSVDLPFVRSPQQDAALTTTNEVLDNLTQVLTTSIQHLTDSSTSDLSAGTDPSVANTTMTNSSRAIVPVSVIPYQWAVLLNRSVHAKVIRQLEASDFETAITTLEDWIDLHRDDTDVYFALVQACYASQRLVKGLYYCRILLNKLPHHAKAYHAMALIAHALEDIEGAIEAYKTAITFGLDPSWTAGIARELASVFMTEKQDADHSIACLKLSQELFPDELEAQFQLAELYCDLGDYHQAITTYERLGALQPTNADIYGFLGFLYWQVDRFTEAEEAYLRTIELEPTNAIAFNNLGVLYLDVHGDSTKALQQFETATSINAQYTMAWFNQGRVFQQQGQVAKAKVSYRKAQVLNETEACELDPQELANRLRQLGD